MSNRVRSILTLAVSAMFTWMGITLAYQVGLNKDAALTGLPTSVNVVLIIASFISAVAISRAVTDDGPSLDD